MFFAMAPSSGRTWFLGRPVCSKFLKELWFAGRFENCGTRNAPSLIDERKEQVPDHQVFSTIGFGALNCRFDDALKRRRRLRVYLRPAVRFKSSEVRPQPRFDS